MTINWISELTFYTVLGYQLVLGTLKIERGGEGRKERCGKGERRDGGRKRKQANWEEKERRGREYKTGEGKRGKGQLLYA